MLCDLASVHTAILGESIDQIDDDWDDLVERTME